jgi:hypothetical protein
MRKIKTFYEFEMQELGDNKPAFCAYYNNYNWHIFTITHKGLILNSGLSSGFERTKNGLYILPDCDVI